MNRGFVQSGKLGPIPGTRRLGVAVPIANASSYDSCPAGYTRNAVGVCMLPPGFSGSTTLYTNQMLLAGRGRR